MSILQELKTPRINCGVKKTQYIYLRSKNKFGKFSVQIKFYKNSEQDLEDLNRIKEEYKEFTESYPKIKEEKDFYILEVSNKFRRFAVMDSLGNTYNSDVPLMGRDTELEIFFEIYKTAKGFAMPMLTIVVIHKIEYFDSENNRAIEVPKELRDRLKIAKEESDKIKFENDTEIDKELDDIFTTIPRFPNESLVEK